jgi:molybdenum cofactor cytidylyltransferase
MISAILLAAGESRRMGDFKQLLPLRGKTFVECCVDQLLATSLDEVIVVTGHRHLEVQQALAGRPVRFAFNPDYQSGMSSSILCGVRALNDSTSAILIALADQPQIQASLISKVIAAYQTERPLLVVPVYADRRGHPIILDARLRDEILALDPAQGLRQVVQAHKDQALFLELMNDAILLDFDYPQDYQSFLAQEG